MTPGRYLKLAWRNLWRNRRRTLITVSTVAVGFALAVFAIGLGDGAHNQMIRHAIRMGEGHLTVQPAGYLATPSNGLYLADGEAAGRRLRLGADVQVAPRIFLQVLAATAYNSLGVGLQGIAPDADPYADLLAHRLVAGAWLRPEDDKGVLIGVRMADKLKARVGSKLVLMAGGRDGTVESRLGRVRGIFHAGLEQVDGFLMLGTLGLARPLLPGLRVAQDGTAVTRLAIYLEQPERMASVRAALEAAPLPQGAVVLDWQEMMPQVVNFIIVDDLFNYIWLVFILVMVAFGIVNTILMSALERTREFGLLRALGMQPTQVLVLMVCETVLLALVAMALGWVVGGAAHAYFAVAGLDVSGLYPEGVETAGMYMDPVMYPELSPGRIAALSAIVCGTTLLSGLYPALKAAGISPVAALRT